MNVELLDRPDENVDAYVTQHAHGKLCHTSVWTFAIAKAMGHDPLHLVARDETGICGVLPLMHVKSRLFGNRLISQGFSNYGGPLTDRAEVLTELSTRALDLVRENRCPIVEFRNSEPMAGDFLLQNDKACMVLPLAPNPDAIWQGLRPEIRNRVRKAEKSGLVAVNGREELLDAFYDVWTVRMRQLGTPCYSRHLFETLVKYLPECTRVFVVKDGQLTMAAGFFHHFNGVAECRWAAATMDSNSLSPNTLLYWSAIKYYCLAGERLFDFGRSTIGSSQYEFKRRWGAKETQLYYQYWIKPGYQPSLVRPDSPRYEKKVEMWKTLPLFATRLLGPCVSRGLA